MRVGGLISYIVSTFGGFDGVRRMRLVYIELLSFFELVGL